MLLGGIQAADNQVAVVTRNQKFSRLLCGILAGWKLFAVGDLRTAKVVFAERGLKLPEHVGHVVWLTPMPLPEGSFLTVPISLTRLYRLLQERLPISRHHIRIVMDQPVGLGSEDSWLQARLLSLSSRGGRISCAREIAVGGELELRMKLAGRVFRISAEVLYRIPAGDSAAWSQPQLGVLFKSCSVQEFLLLQRCIESICIEQACAKEGIPTKDLCLSWFDVMNGSRDEAGPASDPHVE